MSKQVKLECMCGSVKGSLKVVPRSFFNVQCLCCDCQRFAGHLNNQNNILDEHGASELFQTYPKYMSITQGHEHLVASKQTPKGIIRWSTACCNMPIANTLESSKVPFAGVSVKLMKFDSVQHKNDTLGPVTLKAFGKYAIGEMPADAHPRFPKSYLPKIMAFMLKGFVLRKHTPSPFFNGDQIITSIQRLY